MSDSSTRAATATGSPAHNNAMLSIPLWLVWTVAVGLTLGGLGDFGILDNNEGLYAEIPREMLSSGDWRAWVIPHLNGLPYLEKPPLLYWLTALSFAVFGQAEWAARLVPAASSLACVALLLRFGAAVGRPAAGRLAALMFASGIGVITMSHLLMFDMLLTALLTAALMYGYRYLAEGGVRLVRLAYALLALALMAKGFVALILFGLVIAGFMLFCSRSTPEFLRACRTWFDPWGLLIFVAIAAPWHLIASLTEPMFAWFYFLNEHVLRFLGKREPHDYYSGAWWYYLPRIAIYLFPWSFLLPCLLMQRKRRQPMDKLPRFLLLAWLAPLLFFSLSSAKANYYLIAVMPLAAFHLAFALEQRDFLRPAARLLPGVLIGAAALGVAVAAALRSDAGSQALPILGMEQSRFILLAAAGAALWALAGAFAAWRSARLGILAYLALPLWIAAALMAALHSMEPTLSARALAQYLQNCGPERTVYFYRDFEQRSSLPFYLKKPVPIIDSDSSDLFWGNKLRRNNRIMISSEQFMSLSATQPAAVVVIERRLRDFRAAPFSSRFSREIRIGGSTLFLN